MIMSTSPTSPRWRARIGLASLLFTIVVTASSAQGETLNLTGTYGDKGTIFSTASGPTTGDISLHGLLDFEFRPDVNPRLHPNSDEVKLSHEGRAIVVKIYDANGETTKEDWWHYEERMTPEGRCAMVGFPDPENANAKLFFILQPISDGRLLQVKVTRIVPSNLGPNVSEVGTYFFPRDP